MYQVVSISPFQIEVHNTTLETCTDVVYDGMNDVISEYGKLLTGRTVYDYDYEVKDYSKRYEAAIRLDAVINEVHRQFDNNPKLKTVTIDFHFNSGEFYDNSYHRELQQENVETFKPAGLMYSSKLDCFKKWKAPKPSSKVKPKKVPKKLLQLLRTITVDMIDSMMFSDNGISLDIKGFSSIKSQGTVVKFGKKLGYTYQQVINRKGKSEEWYVCGMSVKSNILLCIKDFCKDDNELEQLSIKAYKEWFDSI